MNCVAASELPDVKGMYGSINPYLVLKWDGEVVKKVSLATFVSMRNFNFNVNPYVTVTKPFVPPPAS